MPNPLSIDRALMQHLADLARLHIPTERQALLRERLERIVAAFSALQEAAPTGDAAGTAPSLPLRADAIEPPLPVDTVLANAPQHAAGSFVVPRVIDA